MYKKYITYTFLILSSVLLWVFGWRVYQYQSILSADNALVPFVLSASGTLTVVRWDIAYHMIGGETLPIISKDRIISGKDSLAVITWPDGSVTRMGSTTELLILELRASKDLSDIGITIDLQKGKTWTNIIRVFFGDSHFDTRIRGQEVTAAVRGTIFEINLEKNYIHAVDHAVNLTDKKGNTLDLLPGEIVKVSSILDRLSAAVLDISWNYINEYSDIELLRERTQALQSRIEQLSHPSDIFDTFVRWILSFFPSFDRIEAAAYIRSGSSSLAAIQEKVSTEALMGYYAQMQNLNYPIEIRQFLRETIRTVSSPEEQQRFGEALVNGALWDRLSASGSIDIPTLDTFIESFSGSLSDKTKNLINHLETVDYTEKLQSILESGIGNLQEKIENIQR